MMDDDEPTELMADDEGQTHDNAPLAIIRSRAVRFYEDELFAVQATDNSIYVPLRRLCQNLKLDAQAQTRRIRRSDVLDEGLRVAALENSGSQDTLVLRADLIPLWLSGVSTTRIQDAAIRSRLILYQRECARVLWNEFSSALPADLTTPDAQSHAIQTSSTTAVVPAEDNALFSGFAGNPESTQALIQIRENALAIAHLAEEQLQLQQRLDKAAEVVGGLRKQVNSHETRLSQIENTLQPTGNITEAQAQVVSTTVKALAEELTRQMPSGSVHYNAVFNELYRRFGVTSYKHISLAQYSHVMDFLEDWRKALATGIQQKEKETQ